MTQILKGGPAAEKIAEDLTHRIARLRELGTVPCLAIVRAGDDEGAAAYERGASRRCASLGIELKRCVLPDDVTEGELLRLIAELNGDETVHGVLVLQPMPESIDMAHVRAALDPDKDVDGITNGSLAGVYSGSGEGYPPCCAESCMEMLKYYGIPTDGKHAVIVGRSLVVGRPAAMLLMHGNATVTVCHRKTENLALIAKSADILIMAAGEPGLADREFLSPGQVVLDVGVSLDPVSGKLTGDVDGKAAEDVVAALTPVIGGSGAVTNTVLAAHVVRAAEKRAERRES